MNIQCFGDLKNCGKGRQIGLGNELKPLPVSGSDVSSLRCLFLCHMKLLAVLSDVAGNDIFDLHNADIMEEVTSGEHSPGGSVL